MIVVSDTSPISNLLLIGRLGILHRLFSDVVVPPAVDREVRALKDLGKSIDDYEKAEWIRVVDPRDREKVHALMQRLDEGEAEDIDSDRTGLRPLTDGRTLGYEDRA